MVDDIAGLLHALGTDSGRCPVHPAALIRRRGDRRRAAVAVTTTGATIVLVGATAGTGYAIAQHGPARHGGGIGFGSSPTPHSKHHVGHARKPAADQLGPGSATPTPTPASPWPFGSPTPTGSTGTPLPGPSDTTVEASPARTGDSTPTPSLSPH